MVRMSGREKHVAPRGTPVASRSVDALLTAVLDCLPYPLVVLGERRRVLYTNAAARVLIARGDPIALRRSCVRGASIANETVLRRALQNVRDHARPRDRRAVGFVLAASTSARGLLTVALALPDLARARTAGVALFFSDPVQSTQLDPRALAELFHMSRAEAQLAGRIAAGDTLAAAATALGISVNTVRNQLRAVFAKIGVTRQADLLRVLLGNVTFLLVHSPIGPLPPSGGADS